MGLALSFKGETQLPLNMNETLSPMTMVLKCVFKHILFIQTHSQQTLNIIFSVATSDDIVVLIVKKGR